MGLIRPLSLRRPWNTHGFRGFRDPALPRRIALSSGKRGFTGKFDPGKCAHMVLGPKLSVENAGLVGFGRRTTQQCNLFAV